MFLKTRQDWADAEAYWQATVTARCPKCGGKGYSVVDTGALYPRAVPCECRRVVERNVRLMDRGMPKKFLNPKWSLELSRGKTHNERVTEYINDWGARYAAGQGLLLTGPHGRGKTTLACIVGKHVGGLRHPWRRQGGEPTWFTVGFSTFDEVLEWTLENDPQRKRELEDFLYRSDLLILDNVGLERKGENGLFARRTLELVLRKRDNACLPVIVSTNHDEKGLTENYGEDVTDFLRQDCEWVYVAGDNHRQAAGAALNAGAASDDDEF